MTPIGDCCSVANCDAQPHSLSVWCLENGDPVIVITTVTCVGQEKEVVITLIDPVTGLALPPQPIISCELVGDVFGQDAQYAENTDPAGSSSSVFAEYLSIVTPVLDAGTYRIGWVFQYEASTASNVGEYRIEIDDVTNVDQETLKIASAGERKTYANFSFEALAAGAHTIDIDFRRQSGSGVFTIDDAKLEIWRIS